MPCPLFPPLNSALAYSFPSWKCVKYFDVCYSESPFPLFFPFKVVSARLVQFLSHMNFLINLSSSVKTPTGNLTVIELSLWISPGKTDTFTRLRFPILEHAHLALYLELFKCFSVKFYSSSFYVRHTSSLIFFFL